MVDPFVQVFNVLDARTPLELFLRVCVVGTHRSGRCSRSRNGGGGCCIRGDTHHGRRHGIVVAFVNTVATVAAVFRDVDVDALVREADALGFVANDSIDCLFDPLGTGGSERPCTTDGAASTAAGATDAVAVFKALIRPHGGRRGWLLLLLFQLLLLLFFLALLLLGLVFAAVDANAGELVRGRFQNPAAGQ